MVTRTGVKRLPRSSGYPFDESLATLPVPPAAVVSATSWGAGASDAPAAGRRTCSCTQASRTRRESVAAIERIIVCSLCVGEYGLRCAVAAGIGRAAGSPRRDAPSRRRAPRHSSACGSIVRAIDFRACPRKTVIGRIGCVVRCRGSYPSGMGSMTQGGGMIATDKDRYDRMPYRRTGRSGLKLPAVSLGLWQNFGGERPIETQRAIIRRAFDLGITHFDLANNYGPPYGSAEESFGDVLRSDLSGHRDELVISTKAGYDMWPGPYGIWGSRKYLLASLDQSLKRLGLEYVDIFYSHRFDPETPLEETLGALDTAVRQGKALYAGISSYSARRT